MPSRKTCLADLVEETVASKEKRIVSVPDLVYRVRADFPDCEHTDDELVELITAVAVRRGCDLAFSSPDSLRIKEKPGRN